MSTGILSLDYLLGGGWPLGRTAEVFGELGAGKSTLALHSAVACQRDRGIVTLLSVSRRGAHAYDPSYSRRLGIDPKRLVTATTTAVTLPTLLENYLRRPETPLVIVELDGLPAETIGRADLQPALAKFLLHFGSRPRKATLLFVSSGDLTCLRYHAGTRVQLQAMGELPSGNTLVQATAVKHAGALFGAVNLQLTPGDGFDLAADLLVAGAAADALPRDVELGELQTRLQESVAARENLAHAIRRKLFLRSLPV